MNKSITSKNILHLQVESQAPNQPDNFPNCGFRENKQKTTPDNSKDETEELMLLNCGFGEDS